LVNGIQKFNQTYFNTDSGELPETIFYFPFLNISDKYQTGEKIIDTKALLYFYNVMDLYLYILYDRKVIESLRHDLSSLQKSFNETDIMSKVISDKVKNNFAKEYRPKYKLPEDVLKAIDDNATMQFSILTSDDFPKLAFNMTKEILKERLIDYAVLIQLKTFADRLVITVGDLKGYLYPKFC
jgi:hypothetical protein